MNLSYVEVGGTRGELPEGYHHVRRHEVIGAGEAVFRRAAAGLRRWDLHRGAGLRVRAPGPAAVGVRVDCGVGLGPARIWVPCEVVWLLDQPQFFGFGYGTLPGHPECGEEAFELTLDDAGEVCFTIKAFSRPATWYARLAGPVMRAVQQRVTDRYVRAAHRLAAPA